MFSGYFKVHRAFLENGFRATHCYPVAAAVHVEPEVRDCAVKVFKAAVSMPVSGFALRRGCAGKPMVLLSIRLHQKLLLGHFCWSQHEASICLYWLGRVCIVAEGAECDLYQGCV